MVEVQSQIRTWEQCRELGPSKAYKDLKSMVDKLRGTASLPEEALLILEKAKSLAKDLSQKETFSAKSVKFNPTTFARALVREVEGARKGLENAATSIYKAPGKREDQKAETNDIVMPDHDKDNTPPDEIPLPQDRRDDGYYFVILDDTALKDVLGSTFFHLCKAMKEVETVKETNLAGAEEDSEGHEFPCPEVGCKKSRDPFKSKRWLDKHIQKEHSEYEPEAKRRMLDSSVVGSGDRAANDDSEDVEMVETE